MYPRWWVEQSGIRKRRLDEAVLRIRETIKAWPSVEGVLLFGSYACNRVGPESDLDMIVIQRSSLPITERGREIRKMLNSLLEVPYDLIVYTPDEFEAFSTRWPFVIQARSEGIWIDARSAA